MLEDNPVCYGLKRITSITPTICTLMDVEYPDISTKEIGRAHV